jgi:hypothetical protein
LPKKKRRKENKKQKRVEAAFKAFKPTPHTLYKTLLDLHKYAQKEGKKTLLVYSLISSSSSKTKSLSFLFILQWQNQKTQRPSVPWTT